MPASLTRDIRLSTPLKARPERVYQALTSARELCLWWLARAETDARSLGRVRMVWRRGDGPLKEARGVYVDLEPGRKVAWIWKPKPPGVPPLVSLFLEPKGRGCVATLHHAGFPASPEAGERLAAWRRAWEDCLARLKAYVER